MTEIHPTQQAIEEAIDRIARTPDGAALYVLLQRRMMKVLGTADGGALYTDNGERMFAARLVSLMAKGIFESGGRTSNTSSGSTGTGEQPVVVPVPVPRRVDAGRGSRRRVTEHTVVPGWNDKPADEA